MEASADLQIAAVAAEQFGVFSVAQAKAAGLDADDIGYRTTCGRWGRMHRGVYRIAGSPPTFQQAVMGGWLATGAGALVAFTTAGRLLGFPVRTSKIEVTVASRSRPAVRGVIVHRTSVLMSGDRTTVGPFVTTSVNRTLIDLAGTLDEARLVACIDYAVSTRATTIPAVRRRIEAIGRAGRGNVARLERILDARYPLDRAPESPLERSVVDLLALLPGAPIVLQFWLQLPDGSWIRFDGAWPHEMVAVEIDSYLHHSSPDAWALDKAKRTVLAVMGWRILSFTQHDATTRPDWVLQQVAAARGLRLAS